jgi:hypothetical protein
MVLVPGRCLKYIDSKWTVVPPADRLQLTQLEGQVCLVISYLSVSPAITKSTSAVASNLQFANGA